MITKQSEKERELDDGELLCELHVRKRKISFTSCWYSHTVLHKIRILVEYSCSRILEIMDFQLTREELIGGMENITDGFIDFAAGSAGKNQSVWPNHFYY